MHTITSATIVANKISFCYLFFYIYMFYLYININSLSVNAWHFLINQNKIYENLRFLIQYVIKLMLFNNVLKK